MSQLHPDSPAYQVSLVLDVDGTVCADRIRDCVAHLVLRHPALRTNVQLKDGEPVKVLRAERLFDFEVVEVTDSTASSDVVRQHAAQKTDTAKDPLLRVLVVSCNGRVHQIAMSFHVRIYRRFFDIFIRSKGTQDPCNLRNSLNVPMWLNNPITTF